jgi:molybdopterin/thiamine biosynthesis adenylyltransferase
MSKGRRRVMIIGAGGIGSYLIPLLDKTMVYNMTVMDPDNVEKKNLTYQNFKEKENGMNKASVMNWNYDSVKQFSPYPVLTEKQIKSFDLVVCCADNLDVRRLLYRSNVPWLDLRAQGRNGSTEGQHFSHIIAAGMGAEWIHRYFAKDDVADFKVVNV